MNLRIAIPLVAIVAAGGGGLAGYRAGTAARAPDRTITVDASLLDGLRADHRRRAGRPPTPEEERALVDRFADTEMLYREALALGLDRGDVIVRRRLVQVMELRAEDAATATTPTEGEIAEELRANPARWQRPARTALTHVFFARDRHPDALREAAAALPTAAGDPFIRGNTIPLSTDAELAAIFGPDFPPQLAARAPGAWTGPIRSSYGAHLVRIDAREPARAPSLDEARAEVTRHLVDHRRAQAREAMLAHLRAKYRIRVARSEAR